jgi:hypothetical protein
MRWLALDDGKVRVAPGVLDTCLIPVEFADQVGTRATQASGISVKTWHQLVVVREPGRVTVSLTARRKFGCGYGTTTR